MITTHHREQIINNYVAGYNAFDVEKMIKDFSEAIVFENIQQGKQTMLLHGLDEFKIQAEAAKIYFTARQQSIKSFKHERDQSIIEIDYVGVLAIDLPNGMKKGEEIRLSGQSIFEFNDNTIIRLTDIS